MKKYIGFILTALFLIAFFYTNKPMYEEDNKLSMDGKYISNSEVRANIARQELMAMFIKDSAARDLELKNVENKKIQAYDPARPLDGYQWTKDFLFNNMFGQMTLMMSFISIMLSFSFFIKFYIQEKYNKEKVNLSKR